MLSTITFTMLASLALAGPVGDLSAEAAETAGPENKAKDPPADEWTETEDVQEITETEMEDFTAEDTWYAEAYPLFDRHFNLMTARTARPLSFLFVIYHRTNSPLRKDPFHNWLGFDSGALKVGMGLRFGVVGGLDLGFLRMNGTIEPYDTYEFDLKYQLLKQEERWLDLALRLGASWFAHPDEPDALKPFGQVLLNRVFMNRLLVSLGMMLHSDSSGPTKMQQDQDWTVAVGAALDVRITESLAFGAEIAYGLLGYAAKYPTITLGPKFITNRHTFSLVITNTQYFTADGIVANTDREFEDLIIGFNITRELEL